MQGDEEEEEADPIYEAEYDSEEEEAQNYSSGVFVCCCHYRVFILSLFAMTILFDYIALAHAYRVPVYISIVLSAVLYSNNMPCSLVLLVGSLAVGMCQVIGFKYDVVSMYGNSAHGKMSVLSHDIH